MAGLSDLGKLVHPFPSRLVKTNPGPGGGSYVSHGNVEQRLLDVLGSVDFEVVGFIRGHVGRKEPFTLTDVIVGCRATMTAEIDGKRVAVTEVGDCESPTNWDTDGKRAKDAASDAYKRCAMRLGVGLHMWAGDDFYLADKLAKREGTAP